MRWHKLALLLPITFFLVACSSATAELFAPAGVDLGKPTLLYFYTET